MQRNSFKLIPNDMYDFLTNYLSKPLKEFELYFLGDDYVTVSEYIKFIIDNEFGFITEEPNLFPKLDLSYRSPGIINNAILDRDHSSEYSVKDAVHQLEKLGCSFIQIRCFDTLDLVQIENLCQLFENSRIRSFELILKYQEQLDDIKYFTRLVITYQRLTTIVVHSSNDDAIKYQGIGNLGKVVFTTQIIANESHCGFISPLYFVLDTQMFTEAQNFNTCLNKKVSIDSRGNIKNCPATLEIYGNSSDTSLEQAIDHANFKDVWFVNKDNIDICKDCEFRYICTDCRAFTQHNGRYTKPLNCSYDPYTATWD